MAGGYRTINGLCTKPGWTTVAIPALSASRTGVGTSFSSIATLPTPIDTTFNPPSFRYLSSHLLASGYTVSAGTAGTVALQGRVNGVFTNLLVITVDNSVTPAVYAVSGGTLVGSIDAFRVAVTVTSGAGTINAGFPVMNFYVNYGQTRNAMTANKLLSGWARKCVINLSHLILTGNLPGFPWVIQGDAFPPELWSYINADGSDIRFTTDLTGNAGTGIHAQITNVDKLAHTITVFLTPPSSSASVDTPVVVWYGNAGATTPPANDPNFGSQGVWDANYVFVGHMDEITGNILDSTAYNNTLAPPAGVPGTTSGQIDTARLFAPLQYAQVASPDLAVFTLEMWADPAADTVWALGNSDATAASSQIGVLLGGGAGANWYNFWSASGGSGYFWPAAGLAKQHMALVDDGIFADVRGYTNGVQQTVGSFLSTAKPPVSSCGHFTIGALGDTFGTPYSGWLDEVRISNIIRSDDWIKSGFNNQNNIAASATPGTPVNA